METHAHDLPNLFRQLGLPGGPHDIDAFVQGHRLAPGVPLPRAPFWNPAQAAFLAQCLADDSDWAEAADELARRLS